MNFLPPLKTFEISGIPWAVDTQLPDFVERVIRLNEHDCLGDYSVTELLDHPRCAAMRRLHPEMTERDPSTLVAALVGKAVHEYFEKRIEGRGFRKELPVMINLDSVNVSGTIDVAEFDEATQTLTVYDIKNWKSWRYMAGDFEDLSWQTNMYATMLAKQYGNRVKNLVVRGIVFIMDWNARDAAIHKENYPPRPAFLLKPSTPLPEATVIKFIRDRIKAHMALKGVPEEDWPDADKKDVFQNLEAFKVFKHGATRATSKGVFLPKEAGSEEAAEKAAEAKLKELGGTQYGFVKTCTSARKRCESYCAQASLCTAYQRYVAQEGPEDRESATPEPPAAGTSPLIPF